MKTYCAVLISTFAFLSQCRGSIITESSPCPRLFIYERSTSYSDRWYGIITLLSDSNLTGIWLRISFDRPILQLGNWFGEVVKKSPTDYLIKNPNFNLKSHTPQIVRIFVKYNINQPVPKLEGFRLNAKTVCPEEVISTTPTTTTEHLFTSKEENLQFGATTAEPQTFPSGNNVISDDPPTALGSNEQPLFISHQQHSSNEICGTVTVEPTDTSSQVAYKGQYPWHVALYYTKDITIAYLCGASLISKTHLITVAHCVIKGSTQTVVNPDRLVLYLGKYFLKHWAQEGTQTRYVSKIIPHSDYKAETNTNDIAIVKMTHPCDFTEVVRPICLWKNDVTTKVGSVIGWGFDENGRIEEALMHVEMTIQDSAVCNAAITNYTVKFTNESTYCANFLDATTECVGDSGGGMAFLSNDGTWQLRGIVTVSVVLQHQLKCGPDQFVVFTDVTKYEKWIRESLLL